MDDTSKPKVEQSDSEAFDIAVRRDDTRSLKDVLKDSETDDTVSSDDLDQASFEEKETTTPGIDEESLVENDQTVDSESSLDDESKKAAPEVVAEELPQPTDPFEVKTAPTIAAATTSVAAAPAVVTPHHNSPGSLVLQWLSYAFWGWFGTSLAILAAITFNYFIAGSDATQWGENLAYPLAAVIVMLVIALVTDFFYARHEPLVKKGAASVIMLIHVVVYLLTVVAALIGIVFSVISMMITASPVNSMDGTKVFMLTAFVGALVFGAISLRALFAGKKRGVRKGFWLLMSVLALGFVIASIAGPAMKANSTKDDRLLEDALPLLASDIRDYARVNDKLPASLGDVKSNSSRTDERVQLMVDRNLVTYKANTKPAETDVSLSGANGASTKPQSTIAPVDTTIPSTKTFFYQLCVTYKEAKKSKYYSSSSYEDNYVSSGVSTYSHDKGNVCYDVSAEGKNSYYTY